LSTHIDSPDLSTVCDRKPHQPKLVIFESLEPDSDDTDEDATDIAGDAFSNALQISRNSDSSESVLLPFLRMSQPIIVHVRVHISLRIARLGESNILAETLLPR
jgi:hypothetical protein